MSETLEAAADRHECGVCWHVYDAAAGDEAWQVPPGTPFAALPAHWRCPNCDSGKERFLALGADSPMAARLRALAAGYRAAEARLRGLPVHNPALEVALVGFVAQGEGFAGVAVTPWSMNLVWLPARAEAIAAALGETVEHVLPGGAFDFLVVELDGVGRFLSCSLFSPMAEFADAEAARLAAEAAAQEALTPPAPPPPPARGRRALFGG
ncbi:[NiFe]-hydrogenase assembly chaperone HybE [Paracraurococcus lichenis]|uniref:Rubredoxin n=1 Tax=Paracraurococcus lichenis TaxID=3064888 RepID=A0ABT9DZK7_9PROT|nr:[NiFe]-hydrogenase assembly chaperone HybE [Paracraurococcus sp. LOR1-02]MDO9709325.1 [NiFe]-hydrogenase assembly chaperone HybE [Paracraurococcus sp. LOR1-02]